MTEDLSPRGALLAALEKVESLQDEYGGEATNLIVVFEIEDDDGSVLDHVSTPLVPWKRASMLREEARRIIAKADYDKLNGDDEEEEEEGEEIHG